MLPRKTSIAAAMGLLLFSGAATAQSVRLTAREARAVLFGVEFVGVSGVAGDTRPHLLSARR